jgi:methyltransferase (TIGR00027 family)
METTSVSLPVDHVSDTAYLVALYRAYESERADACIKDPLARKLAAPKAEYLEKAIPFNEAGIWMMALRTRLLDDHILKLVNEEGVDTVVNLAAGLDTRPYRLDLPSDVRWIEADFPEITRYKTERLADEKPRCRLERVVVDLNDNEARRRFFAAAFGPAKKALVITEGLLPYLKEETVRAIAADLKQASAVTAWLMDVTVMAFIDWFRAQVGMKEEPSSDVKLQFAPIEGTEYFESLGWRTRVFDSFLDGSKRFNKQLPMKMGLDKEAMVMADDSGIALLIKA